MKDDILLIDKPAGWTSFDVVAKVRSELRRRQSLDLRSQKTHLSSKIKVGHAGTLDPFATGLLIILVGEACKKAGEFLKLDKTYEFTAKLGEVSATGDPEGEISKTQNAISKKRGFVIPGLIGPSTLRLRLEEDPVGKIERSEASSILNSNVQRPNSDEVKQALKQFVGDIEQTPPAYSAIKVGGKRAYKLAREGKKVEIPSRKVRIDRLELISYEYPYLKCVCDVSSGTYIRTLVEDIGKALQTGAYCTQLHRTRVGQFTIQSAERIEGWLAEQDSQASTNTNSQHS